MQKSFSIAFVLLFAFAAAAFAHEGEVESSPAVMPAARSALGLFKPDSPLYSFQRLGEWLKLTFTTNPLERAKYELTLIERRAEELRDLAERGRLTVERAEAIQRRTQQLIEGVQERTEAARKRGLNVEELAQKTQTILDRQQTVLQNVFERVPDAAKDAIRRAIEASRTGKERALDIIRRLETPLPVRPSPVGPRPTAAAPQAAPRRPFSPLPAPTRTPIPTPASLPSPSPSPSPTVISVTVEADDRGLYPETITVPKGATVRLTFKVRSSGVYYGGLDFKSNKFITPAIPPGGSNSVTFTADETFTYSSYWPRSGVKKAEGTVVVE